MAKEGYKEHATEWSCSDNSFQKPQSSSFYTCSRGKQCEVLRTWMHRTNTDRNCVREFYSVLPFFFLKKANHNIFLKGHVILSQQDTSCVELKKGGSSHNSMLHLLICHIAHSTLKTKRGSDCLTMCEYSRTCRIEKQVFKKLYHSSEGWDTDLSQHYSSLPAVQLSFCRISAVTIAQVHCGVSKRTSPWFIQACTD